MSDTDADAVRQALEAAEASGATVLWSSCSRCGRPRDDHAPGSMACPPATREVHTIDYIIADVGESRHHACQAALAAGVPYFLQDGRFWRVAPNGSACLSVGTFTRTDVTTDGGWGVRFDLG